MLFAQAEAFWKPPNVIDVASILLAVGSIWLAWWLAKRDIQSRLKEAADAAAKAARDEVRRVAGALLQTGLADVVRLLELAREAARPKRWIRVGELCELAQGQLARIAAQPGLDETTRTELEAQGVAIFEYTNRVRRQPRQGSGDVQEAAQQSLDFAIRTLHAIHARLTAIRPETANG